MAVLYKLPQNAQTTLDAIAKNECITDEHVGKLKQSFPSARSIADNQLLDLLNNYHNSTKEFYDGNDWIVEFENVLAGIEHIPSKGTQMTEYEIAQLSPDTIHNMSKIYELRLKMSEEETKRVIARAECDKTKALADVDKTKALAGVEKAKALADTTKAKLSAQKKKSKADMRKLELQIELKKMCVPKKQLTEERAPKRVKPHHAVVRLSESADGTLSDKGAHEKTSLYHCVCHASILNTKGMNKNFSGKILRLVSTDGVLEDDAAVHTLCVKIHDWQCRQPKPYSSLRFGVLWLSAEDRTPYVLTQVDDTDPIYAAMVEWLTGRRPEEPAYPIALADDSLPEELQPLKPVPVNFQVCTL